MQKYNLIVVGGGLAGVAAAVSAARNNLKVLLIERSGCLGGAMSNNLIYPFMKYWYGKRSDGSLKYLSAGIFSEMRERQNRYEQADSDINFRPEYFKLVLDDMVTEAGVEVLFHASVFEAETEDDVVKSVKTITKSGIFDFEADFFIDATGDGELLEFTKCDYQLGRESDGLCQPMTTCFRMSGVDIEQYLKDRPMLQELYKKYREEGKITNPRENILSMIGIGEGILHLNTTRVIKHDPTNAFDVSRAEMIARRQIYEISAFLKENSVAFKNSTIISIATQIGVRESRKLKGVHILTADELKNCVSFEDTIALGNYEIDIHNPSGTGTELYYFKEGEYYQIPYRSLLPKEYKNMLVAGRNISADHAAHSAVRIMPICTCMGEAAGTAVAVAHHDGSDMHQVDIKKVRQKLLENGAAL